MNSKSEIPPIEKTYAEFSLIIKIDIDLFFL